jgi:hypothetical protein
MKKEKNGWAAPLSRGCVKAEAGWGRGSAEDHAVCLLLLFLFRLLLFLYGPTLSPHSSNHDPPDDKSDVALRGVVVASMARRSSTARERCLEMDVHLREHLSCTST